MAVIIQADDPIIGPYMTRARGTIHNQHSSVRRERPAPSSPWCKFRVAPRPAKRQEDKARRPSMLRVCEGGAT